MLTGKDDRSEAKSGKTKQAIAIALNTAKGSKKYTDNHIKKALAML